MESERGEINNIEDHNEIIPCSVKVSWCLLKQQH